MGAAVSVKPAEDATAAGDALPSGSDASVVPFPSAGRDPLCSPAKVRAAAVTALLLVWAALASPFLLLVLILSAL